MGIFDDEDTGPLDIIFDIARMVPEALQTKKADMRSRVDVNPVASAGVGIGADLVDAFTPQSGGDLLFDLVTEMGGGPAMAFIPPNILSKLNDIPLKIPKNVRKVSPELADKTEEFGVGWLEELVEKSSKEAKTSLHGTGNTPFTGDEIDLTRGATGAGGDFMGRVFYSTNDEDIATGYVKSALMNAVAEGDVSISKYWKEAGKRLEKKYGADFVGSKPRLADFDGRPEEFQDQLRKYMTQGDERSKMAFDLGMEGEDFGHIIEIITQPGSGVIKYEEPFEEGFKQAIARSPVSTTVMDEIESITGKGTRDIIEKRIRSASSPEDMTSGIHDILKDRDLLALDPNATPNAAADITNRVLRELGIDQIDYPSGMNFTDYQGSRNYATLNPAVLGETPIDEVLLGNEHVGFDVVSDLMAPDIEPNMVDQDYWDDILDELVGTVDVDIGQEAQAQLARNLGLDSFPAPPEYQWAFDEVQKMVEAGETDKVWEFVRGVN